MQLPHLASPVSAWLAPGVGSESPQGLSPGWSLAGEIVSQQFRQEKGVLALLRVLQPEGELRGLILDKRKTRRQAV